MIQTIGVIGGGQLGRMFALDAKRMGYGVVVLDPTPHSPCGQVADDQIVAPYDDLSAIEELGRRTDIVTYEFENVAIESVRYLERHGYAVTPSSAVLGITQDRIVEKSFVRECGIPAAPFAPVRVRGDLERAASSVGFPAVLKTVHGGYDGKGQWRVGDLPQAVEAFEQACGAELIWEAFVPFRCEISVVCTRSAKGEVVCFPAAENRHDRGILSLSIAPARVDEAVARRAAAFAAQIARSLKIVGTCCVEFFVTRQDELLVNEIAPRPHNSGHYTIDATPCSQYEEHVRAVCGLPLSPPQLLRSAVMVNILGTGAGNRLYGVDRLLQDPSIVLHLYGKRHAVARRKMGHLTMLVNGPVTDADILHAQDASALLSWGDARGGG